MARLSDVVPYTCVRIDADLNAIANSAKYCISRKSMENRTWALNRLSALFTTDENNNNVLPCLCVRSGFDLFCRAMEFPRGSEIIMSAINIPDMVTVAEHNQLHVVPWDVEIDTVAPKVKLLPELITDNTVAVLVAHIYGTTLDMSPILDVCDTFGIIVIEDCAQAFGGFSYLGNPRSDVALFSFGVIKYQTAFGGAIVKVKRKKVYERMVRIHETYIMQRNADYLKKLIKYSGIYLLINVPAIISPGMKLGKFLKVDYQTRVVNWLRGFRQGLIGRIRLQPCTALLVTMAERLWAVSEDEFLLARFKAHYVINKISDCVRIVGSSARQNNFWLFPVLVEDAIQFSTVLNNLGVDSYRGATQLDVILPRQTRRYNLYPDPSKDLTSIRNPVQKSFLLCMQADESHFDAAMDLKLAEKDKIENTEGLFYSHKENYLANRTQSTAVDLHWPHDAQYLIDHVVYLPVHKDVPFSYLTVICEAVKLAALKCDTHGSAKLRSKL